MNQQMLFIMGRATKDAQVLSTKKGKDFSKFSVAVNGYRGPEKEETTNFYEVLGFSQQSKAAGKRIKKGDIVLVTGRPKISLYESKSGETKFSFDVSASFIGRFGTPEYVRKLEEAEKSILKEKKEEIIEEDLL